MKTVVMYLVVALIGPTGESHRADERLEQYASYEECRGGFYGAFPYVLSRVETIVGDDLMVQAMYGENLQHQIEVRGFAMDCRAEQD
jgi:hypothetical protein